MEKNLLMPDAIVSSVCPHNGKICSGNESVPVNPIPKDFPVENQVVNLYPEFTYQKILGFGGAMTESAGYVLSLLPEKLRKEAIREYFGDGGYTLLRVPVDSCDFSLGMYQAVADSDPELNSFSLERDQRYIIPAIRDAIEASDEPISVLLSPWSPPAKWKTQSSMLKDVKSKEDLKRFLPPNCRKLRQTRLIRLCKRLLPGLKNL